MKTEWTIRNLQWERATRRVTVRRANRSAILGVVWRAQRRLNDGHAERSVAPPAGRVAVAGCQFARSVDVLRRDPVSFKPLSRVCLFSSRRVSYRLLFSPPPPFPARVHEIVGTVLEVSRAVYTTRSCRRCRRHCPSPSPSSLSSLSLSPSCSAECSVSNASPGV